MTLRNCITVKRFAFCVFACGLFVLPGAGIRAQCVAVIVPAGGHDPVEYSPLLAEKLSQKAKVPDAAMTGTAFDALGIEAPFNLSKSDAVRAAGAVGCEYMVLVRSGSGRRESFEKGAYYEAWAAIYLVSGRNGGLISWKLERYEAQTQMKATEALRSAADTTAADLIKSTATAREGELKPGTAAAIEQVPDENSPRAKGLRPPIPYRRIKPGYTRTAYLYGIQGTVDIEVDIDAAGNVTRTEIVRWAGFGLDESAVDAIRKMNWRPAERDGRTLPMRILLRYNFTKVETD